MKNIPPTKNLDFVISATAEIQLNQNAGFQVKPGMTTVIIALLIALFLLPSSAHAEKNILVFGDSLSAGYGIARDTSWVKLLADELHRTHPQYALVNGSISGETSGGGLRRIDQALQQHHPDIVILELGANDGLRGNPLPLMRENLSAIIQHAQAAHARVLLVGMRLPPNYGKTYVSEFQTIYVQLAKQHRVALLPFLLDGITAQQFQADNLHPDADAQPRIMDNVLHSLLPLLK